MTTHVRSRGGVVAAPFIGVLLLVAGCAPSGSGGPEAHALGGGCRIVELGRSVRGRPVEALVFGATLRRAQGAVSLSNGTGGCVLILGGIHGDEPASSRLVELLARELSERPGARAGRCVVLIPRANPDGLAANRRTNACGVDLNRNFATGNFRPCRRHGRHALSEPEARAIDFAITRYRPSCIVSVHGPLNCIDPDGGAASWRLARQMAAVSPLPLRDLKAHPGSLGTHGGVELGLKMITYELDRKRIPARNPARYLRPHLAPLLLAIRKG